MTAPLVDLSGKVALVTGGARGIGAAVAELFVQLGARVVIGDVRDEQGRSLAEKLGPSCLYVPLDVTQPAAWKTAVAKTGDRFGNVNVLMNNAGIVAPGPIETQPLEDYLKIIMVNQVGCFLGMQAAVPAMRAAGGGSIINVSSIAGVIGNPAPLAAYTASKFAVRGMTKIAAIELGPENIRVNVLIPGAILTEMNTSDPAMYAALQKATKRHPIPRFAPPSEMANIAAFLASDASSFCTGADFAADGGVLAGILRDPAE